MDRTTVSLCLYHDNKGSRSTAPEEIMRYYCILRSILTQSTAVAWFYSYVCCCHIFATTRNNTPSLRPSNANRRAATTTPCARIPSQQATVSSPISPSPVRDVDPLQVPHDVFVLLDATSMQVFQTFHNAPPALFVPDQTGAILWEPESVTSPLANFRSVHLSHNTDPTTRVRIRLGWLRRCVPPTTR